MFYLIIYIIAVTLVVFTIWDGLELLLKYIKKVRRGNQLALEETLTIEPTAKLIRVEITYGGKVTIKQIARSDMYKFAYTVDDKEYRLWENKK